MGSSITSVAASRFAKLGEVGPEVELFILASTNERCRRTDQLVVRKSVKGLKEGKMKRENFEICCLRKLQLEFENNETAE